jgi:hypothetical protein
VQVVQVRFVEEVLFDLTVADCFIINIDVAGRSERYPEGNRGDTVNESHFGVRMSVEMEFDPYESRRRESLLNVHNGDKDSLRHIRSGGRLCLNHTRTVESIVALV